VLVENSSPRLYLISSDGHGRSRRRVSSAVRLAVTPFSSNTPCYCRGRPEPGNGRGFTTRPISSDRRGPLAENEFGREREKTVHFVVTGNRTRHENNDRFVFARPSRVRRATDRVRRCPLNGDHRPTSGRDMWASRRSRNETNYRRFAYNSETFPGRPLSKRTFRSVQSYSLSSAFRISTKSAGHDDATAVIRIVRVNASDDFTRRR